MRDHNKEFQDSKERKYAYDFDYILRKYMLRTFEPFIDKNDSVLELGCFEGDFTKLIHEKYKKLTVIEAASDLIPKAQQKVGPGVKFINSTFEDATVSEKFDTIFLVHTLEHLDNPVEVLNKIGTWMTDRGKLLLVVPNANAPSRQIAVKMGLIETNTSVTKGEFEHGHRKTYAFDSLENEVRKAKLKVTHRGGVFFKPLANYQFDRLIGTDILSEGYLEGCYQLGMQYPDLCASIYMVCTKGS